MNKALLLIAHGSPRKEANEEFVFLVDRIRARLPDRIVQHAFLDCGKPTIAEGIDLLAAKKAAEIVVLPYFLVSGKHTVSDIAKIVEGKQNENRSVRISLKPPIGSSPEMIDLILKLLT